MCQNEATHLITWDGREFVADTDHEFVFAEAYCREHLSEFMIVDPKIGKSCLDEPGLMEVQKV